MRDIRSAADQSIVTLYPKTQMHSLKRCKIILSLVILAFTQKTMFADNYTLKGVVIQPEEPFDPAFDATVEVYKYEEIDGNLTLKLVAGPGTTKDDGSFSYEVEKDVQIVIFAVWQDPDAIGKSPTFYGKIGTSVEMNPEIQDVQLFPEKTAGAGAWYAVGRKTYELNRNSDISAYPYYLKSAGIPAASIYTFVSGARSKADGAFEELEGLEMFGAAYSGQTDLTRKALEATEGQFIENGTFPTYLELKSDLEGDLSQRVYWEVLGFVAPSLSGDQGLRWKAAVEKSVDPEARAEVFNKRKTISDAVFPQVDAVWLSPL